MAARFRPRTAWCAYFLRQAGLGRVVLLEKGLLGQGASSRAAGVVRMQGGTPEAVRLGQWSRGFYLSQKDEIGTDSGFTEQGYLLPCFTEARPRDRVTVACAGGAGMMWGPGVARAAADVALAGSSGVLDVSSLGLDRFDEAGRSRLATDPIALPFPERIAPS